MARFGTDKLAGTFAAFGLAAALVSSFGSAAAAQSAQCVEAARIAPLLEQHYGETAAWVGLLPNSNMVEVYHNASSQSWTVAVVVPETSEACVIATGSGQYALNAQLQTLKAL